MPPSKIIDGLLNWQNNSNKALLVISSPSIPREARGFAAMPRNSNRDKRPCQPRPPVQPHNPRT